MKAWANAAECTSSTTYTTLADGTVSLLIVYPKSKTENLSPAFLRELRKLFLE